PTSQHMNEPVIDPAAEVLLDFQSAMAQFLELQTSVIDAMAPRSVRSTGVPAVVPQQPAPIDQVSAWRPAAVVDAAVAAPVAMPVAPPPVTPVGTAAAPPVERGEAVEAPIVT